MVAKLLKSNINFALTKLSSDDVPNLCWSACRTGTGKEVVVRGWISYYRMQTTLQTGFNIKRYIFKYIFFLLLKDEGSNTPEKAFDWYDIMGCAGAISFLLFLKDLAWLIRERNWWRHTSTRKSLSWLSISLWSWFYLSTTFKVPCHGLSQLRWQDFVCRSRYICCNPLFLKFLKLYWRLAWNLALMFVRVSILV